MFMAGDTFRSGGVGDGGRGDGGGIGVHAGGQGDRATLPLEERLSNGGARANVVPALIGTAAGTNVCGQVAACMHCTGVLGHAFGCLSPLIASLTTLLGFNSVREVKFVVIDIHTQLETLLDYECSVCFNREEIGEDDHSSVVLRHADLLGCNRPQMILSKAFMLANAQHSRVFFLMKKQNRQ
jgi:hypothetical protein